MLQCVKVHIYNGDNIVVYYLRLYMFICRNTSSNAEVQVHISVHVVKY